jgi:putative two-component system response regulator
MTTVDNNKRRKIILVDDNMANLTLGKNMLKPFYEVYPVPSAEKLFDLLAHIEADLILLDVMMPEMDGFEAIRRLKSSEQWRDIPVIFLTSQSDEGSELEGFDLGAIDYVYKPFSAPLLLKRIENHLLIEAQKSELKDWNDNLQKKVREKTSQIVGLENSVLNTVAELVEFRDDITGRHIYRTQKYLELLVNRMLEEGTYADQIADWDLDYLLPSAQLHDVGKIAISDTILNKPGRLTEEEFEIMKTHPATGVEIIERIAKNTEESDFLKHATTIAGTHQEKWDGSGYPAGLQGTDIPLEGRLMAIADVYDALISARPYKEAMSHEKAKSIIMENSGSHFDPKLVEVFAHIADKFAEIAAQNRDDEEVGQ